MEKPRVLIVGGGFGGLYAALEFERRRDPDVEVTLISQENFFLFTPMLHEVAASDLDLTHIVNPIRKMLRHVRFFQGEVQSVDLAERRVVVAHGFDRTQSVLQMTVSRCSALSLPVAVLRALKPSEVSMTF
jgi:NADH dehydrogenase